MSLGNVSDGQVQITRLGKSTVKIEVNSEFGRIWFDIEYPVLIDLLSNLGFEDNK